MNSAFHVRGVAQFAPGSLDHIRSRYRRHLEQRVAVGNYTAESLQRTMSYVDSFCAFVYQDDPLPPVRVGSLAIAEAKQRHLVAWLISHFDSWKKGSTRSDALGSVLGCFNWWADIEEEQSPFRRPRNMKFHRTHHRALRKAHYRAVARTMRRYPEAAELRLIVFFCWRTGCRLKEARLLEFDHIDWTERMVDRLHNKTEHQTGEDRRFGIGPWVMRFLRELYRRRKPGQRFIFLTRRRRQWSKDNLGRRFAFYRDKAGVPSTFKLCGTRHGWTVRMLEAGETSKACADHHGHKSTRMVESIYGSETRNNPDRLREIAERGERCKGPRQQPRKRPLEAATPLFDALGDGQLDQEN